MTKYQYNGCTIELFYYPFYLLGNKNEGKCN